MYTPMWSTNPEVAFKALAPSHLQPPKDWPDWKTGEVNLIARPARRQRLRQLVVSPLLYLLSHLRRTGTSTPANVPAQRSGEAIATSIQREVMGGTS